MSTDREWELWGARDAYFGVLTNPKFRSGVLTDEAKAEFFASGRWHVDYVLNTCRKYFDPTFVPQHVLEFGCGVGRLVIPFAQCSGHVVGTDVSPSMLAEAERNCRAAAVQNASLLRSDDTLSSLASDFDLVHSCIVLQHIEIDRGRKLFQGLLKKIRAGGIGALHVTFAWDVYADSYGQPPHRAAQSQPTALAAEADETKPVSRAGRIVSSLALGSARTSSGPTPPTVQAPTGRKADADPEMQMNYYNLSELHYLLQRAGVTQVHTDFTDHGGALGAFLFFRMPAQVSMHS